ncbi:MAG: SufS family cysteine desulfurase [Patescibacteria group bacterium]
MIPKEIRKDFPILSTLIHGKPLVYLDSAATSQKPQCVLDALQTYYTTMNANIHRGIHTLSETATACYEDCRRVAASFFGAQEPAEIIFTKSATESINVIARGWAAQHVKEGDDILVTHLEHHANLVPWQECARSVGARLVAIPLTDDYRLDYEAFLSLVSNRTKILCITALSNVTGTIVDLAPFITAAHNHGAVVLVDASQAAAHMPINVQELDCDFLVCSSHKMYGPTGVGILYAKRNLLEATKPLIYGGDMVTTVSEQSAEFADIPWRFEGGTPNIAGVVALRTALNYLLNLGMDNVQRHTQGMLAYARETFSAHADITLYSPQAIEHADGILSFNIKGVHPHDIASIFDANGVAIRSGVHCAEPLHKQLGIPATARMSFGIYTTKEDIDTAELAVKNVISVFSR